jgi:hypothetical protein
MKADTARKKWTSQRQRSKRKRAPKRNVMALRAFTLGKEFVLERKIRDATRKSKKKHIFLKKIDPHPPLGNRWKKQECHILIGSKQ